MKRGVEVGSGWEAMLQTMRFATLSFMLLAVFPNLSRAQKALTVQGAVTTSSLSPIAGAAVLLAGGGQELATLTDATGGYSISVPAGTYTVSVKPPPGAGFVWHTQSGVSIQTDLTLDVVLVDALPAQFAGRLRDGNAQALAGVTVRLSDGDGGFSYSAKTQADGTFSVAASTAATRLRLECQSWSDCQVFGMDAYATLDLPDVDLRNGSVTGQELTWQTRVVSGTVKNASAAPVPLASLSFQGAIEFGDASGSQTVGTMVDGAGQFSLKLSWGAGELTARAPEGSGLQHLSKALTITSTGPSSQDLVLPAAPRFAGKVVDGHGTAIAGATITLRHGSFSYDGTSAANGSFDFYGPAGVASLSVECFSWSDCTHFGPDASGSLALADVDLSAGSLTNQTLVWQTRSLTGTVTTENGAPLPGVVLSWNQSIAFATSSGSLSQHRVSDSTGGFGFHVSPGTGTITATAPEGAELQNRMVAVVVGAADPPAQNIVLRGAPVYAGQVVDSTGTAVSGARVALHDDNFAYRGDTDTTGAFRVVAHAEATSLSMECYSSSGCAHFGADASASLYLPPVDLSEGSLTGQTLVWQTRTLNTSVTDVDGVPLLGAWLYWDQQLSWDDGDVSGSMHAARSTDVRGGANFLVGPGSGTLTVQPPEENGLLPFALDRAITGSLSLSLLVQFAADAASGELSAAQSLSTDAEGDGATPADPIEVSVRAPEAGSVTIEERALESGGLTSVRFLTQEIAVAVTATQAAQPWILSLRVDASRVPLGYDAQAIGLYFEGAALTMCSSSGAELAPCLLSRGIEPDGDLTLEVAFTSSGTFNIGVSDLACETAADCATNDACAEESCVQKVCRFARREVQGCIPECARDEDCDDGEWCTDDDCQFGTCKHQLSPEPSCQPECEADADCDDDFACTTDLCEGGHCSWELIESEACGQQPPDDGEDPTLPGEPDDDGEGPLGPSEPGAMNETPEPAEPPTGFSLCSVTQGRDASALPWLFGLFVAATAFRRTRSRR